MRKIFKGHDERTYDKARKRLQSISPALTADWANTTLWAVQRDLEQYADPSALHEARHGVVTILAAIDTLLDRNR